MTHVRIKLSVAAAVVISAVGYLTFAGVQRGWVYTVGVDAYVANVQQQAERVRLCGKVSAEGLEIEKAKLRARFVISGEHAALPVTYKGVVPDMFKAGSEVVVEGKRNGAGVFEADTLMTKCASKYEGKNKTEMANGSAGGRP